MLNTNYITPKTLFIAFLAFCVLSSKNIIIYNEETLITLSFILFVLSVSHYFGNTLKESLDEKSENIKAECQNFLHYKEQSLEELYLQHKKIGKLKAALSQLMKRTELIIHRLTGTIKNSLKKSFSHQITQKCGELGTSQLPQNLQHVVAKTQEQLVLIRCKEKDLNRPVLKSAIQLLSSANRKR